MGRNFNLVSVNLMNYYETLEVSANASPEVIKAAYKSLMQRYHPDRNLTGAVNPNHAILIGQAYEVLSDPAKRAAYDVQLKQSAASLQSTLDKRVDALLSRSSSEANKKEPSSYSWLYFMIAAFLGWYFWPSSEKQPIIEINSNKAGASFLDGSKHTIDNTEPPPSVTETQTVKDNSEESRANESKLPKGSESRTIRAYIKDFEVRLKVPEGLPGNSKAYTLSIPRLGVVVGAFESDKFIQYLSSNEDVINQDVAKKLANARYDELVKPGNEDYLKRFILDSFGEITGADRSKAHQVRYGDAPEYYGVVDVLLPESYTVQ